MGLRHDVVVAIVNCTIDSAGEEYLSGMGNQG
jgi:hypothetical protein